MRKTSVPPIKTKKIYNSSQSYESDGRKFDSMNFTENLSNILKLKIQAQITYSKFLNSIFKTCIRLSAHFINF